MASKRALWNRMGRFFTGLVVGCFFLPFFGVSCQGMDVITFSGADMVGGCKPGGMIAKIDEKSKEERAERGAEAGGIEAKIENVEREPFAIAALALAVIAFGLAWVRTRKALLASCVVAVAALGTMIGLYLKVGGDLDEAVKIGLEDRGGGDHQEVGMRDVGKEAEVESGARIGFWAVCAGLIGIAVLTGLALREPEPPPAPPPAPPPLTS